MPNPRDIIAFQDTPPPPGQTPWVVGPVTERIEIVEYDERWPEQAAVLVERIRAALGPRAIQVSHVGSTSVPGLPAKPIIDIDVTVADSANEGGWLPQLERAGLTLIIREPWWSEHRMLKASEPNGNVHVFSPDNPELVRHRIFRDWLRRNPDERERYAAAKRAAATASNERGEQMMDYNGRKSDVIREIYARAFRAAGLLDEAPAPASPPPPLPRN
jgi:GrpB-like predicted nucleotidyltransferase (UPF0157 family)